MITFKVGQVWNRWAVLHHEQPLATYETREEAERAALALATHHPKRVDAEVDLTAGDLRSGIHVF